MQRLEGKVAIVTGGAGGLGSATVARFIAEGAKVVVADIDGVGANTVADECGSNAAAIQFDAVDKDSIKKMVDGTVERFGRLDILVNNHAFFPKNMTDTDTNVLDTPFETWDATMAVNVGSFFASCKFGIPHMLAAGGGSIVNIASGSALLGDVTRLSYGVSKAAVVSLTKNVATQYGKKGIRCNSIAPGLILTETLKRTAPELLDMMLRHILTPRLGVPSDIAALAAFLASEEAGYINGQVISCDGGHQAHHPQTAEVEDFMASLNG